MTAAQVQPPLEFKAPARPEIPALTAAISHPVAWREPFHEAGQVIVLDLGFAKDLLDLVEDLCPDHRRCEACGETVACLPCGVGDLISIDDWCLHLGLCPECRYAGCRECRVGNL